MNKRKIGTSKEELASAFLVKQGYVILEKNYFTVRGELDLIARDNEYLVFVEVKYRKDPQFGYPTEAVGYYKQRKMIDAARYYLFKKKLTEEIPIRFDVVGILLHEILLIKNAFDFK